jgi:hypothetical protein
MRKIQRSHVQNWISAPLLRERTPCPPPPCRFIFSYGLARPPLLRSPASCLFCLRLLFLTAFSPCGLRSAFAPPPCAPCEAATAQDLSRPGPIPALSPPLHFDPPSPCRLALHQASSLPRRIDQLHLPPAFTGLCPYFFMHCLDSLHRRMRRVRASCPWD